MNELVIVGRSSSHFTRVVRLFAHELGVTYAFRPVLDLASTAPATYADNPALKIPILVDAQGPLFGAENICRELVRRSGRTDVLLRGAIRDRLVANAEELTLHVMSTEVTVIMAKLGGGPLPPKQTASMENALSWLDQRLDAVLAALPPDRALSFLEAALFSVVTHLPFRQVMDVTRWTRLGSFVQRFGERPSAVATEYGFDA